jgi:hypothetical protein
MYQWVLQERIKESYSGQHPTAVSPGRAVASLGSVPPFVAFAALVHPLGQIPGEYQDTVPKPAPPQLGKNPGG